MSDSGFMLLIYGLCFVGMLLGTVLARPLATLIYRLRGKGKYLPY